MAMLLALPAVAYGQSATATPDITVTEDQDSKTIVVTGDGTLNVQVLRSDYDEDNFDTLIDEMQIEGFYEYTIARSYDEGYYVKVVATAQEDGKLPSEEATKTFVMRPYFLMPLPEISFYEDEDGLTCEVTNIGPIFELWVEVNGVEFLSYSGGYEDSHSFYVPRSDVEQVILVDAKNNGASHGDIWQGTSEVYTLAPHVLYASAPEIITVEYADHLIVSAISHEEGALVHLLCDGLEVDNPYQINYSTYEQAYVFSAYAEVPNMQPSEWVDQYVEVPPLPMATPPLFEMVEDVDVYTITAYSNEDGATVHLFFDNGEEVENPYTIERSYDFQIFNFKAYAEVPGMQRSEWTNFTVCIEPFPPIIEQTAAPAISCEVIHHIDGTQHAIVTITPIEPSDIYYIATYIDELGYEDISEGVYDQELCFTETGHYRIIAQATAEGKLTSEWSCIEFVLSTSDPIILYDFEEDGIYYKITSEGKVSVCNATSVYSFSYQGHITIPTTVTHEGVTYKVTGIDEYAFSGCSGLTGVTIGAYVTSIGNHAFYHCSALTEVTLDDYVITLGNNAFDGCTSLTSVTLGKGLNYIGSGAFAGCDALETVNCKAATPPIMADSSCFECYNTATLYVYPAVLDSYQAANYWNQFANIVADDKVSPAAGDVDGDGKTSITDVTSLIEMLLNGN